MKTSSYELSDERLKDLESLGDLRDRDLDNIEEAMISLSYNEILSLKEQGIIEKMSSGSSIQSGSICLNTNFGVVVLGCPGSLSGGGVYFGVPRGSYVLHLQESHENYECARAYFVEFEAGRKAARRANDIEGLGKRIAVASLYGWDVDILKQQLGELRARK